MPLRDNNYNSEEVWVTKAGEPIYVKDMNEHHLRNTLRMLIKQIRTGNNECLNTHHKAINQARDKYGIK